jgi:hypothetical protein
MIDTGVLRRIRRRISKGASVDAIDRAVDESAPELEEDERAALWLYAWHHARKPHEAARRERVLELLRGRAR